ncbi:hypothetical protein [Tellurirhabdus bombi]|uniref:hypothetical protein n=1 Tax=Tellurirhabdus bombi TaxID=2907205 RepID=UPI001F38A426|nr:hypothetical protein [Tellurirhabdus bombi]
MGSGSYNSIKTPAQETRMGGLQQKIFAMSYEDFQTLQKPNPAATTPEGRYVIDTAHVPKTGKGFIELYCTKDMSEVNLETIGGADRNSFRGTGKFYHPGEALDVNAFANQAKNDRFVLLAPLPGKTQLIQLGNDEFQVQLKPSYATTTNSGDGRGWTFEIDVFCADMIMYTASTIPMKPSA